MPKNLFKRKPAAPLTNAERFQEANAAAAKAGDIFTQAIDNLDAAAEQHTSLADDIENQMLELDLQRSALQSLQLESDNKSVEAQRKANKLRELFA